VVVVVVVVFGGEVGGGCVEDGAVTRGFFVAGDDDVDDDNGTVFGDDSGRVDLSLLGSSPSPFITTTTSIAKNFRIVHPSTNSKNREALVPSAPLAAPSAAPLIKSTARTIGTLTPALRQRAKHLVSALFLALVRESFSFGWRYFLGNRSLQTADMLVLLEVVLVLVLVVVLVDRKEGMNHTRASAPWDINFHVLLWYRG